LNLQLFDETSFGGELRVPASRSEPDTLLPETEFPGSHIVFRVLLGLASFICCWIAIGWFRQTRLPARYIFQTESSLPQVAACLQFQVLRDHHFQRFARKYIDQHCDTVR
jgi:hypothetical protein